MTIIRHSGARAQRANSESITTIGSMDSGSAPQRVRQGVYARLRRAMDARKRAYGASRNDKSRRAFIAALGGAAALAATARAGHAQERIKRVAVLGPAEEPRFSEMVGGLRRGLRDLGQSEPALIESKVLRGDVAGVRARVEEAMRQETAVLFVIGSELAKLARQISPELPIVFVTPGDPVAAGIVASLARPGGNITAMTFEFPELSAKRLELLNALAPRVRRVLALYDPRDASPRQGLAAAREAAPKLGLTLVERETQSEADISRELASMEAVDAILAIPGGVTAAHYPTIIRAAHARLLPTFFHSRTGGGAEALASYGASDVSIARESARIVDKILKGEKAGDLPVERPTKFELVINLRTAKVLGVDVPPALLVRADEVIE
jgi:putative ABC transport system substrate-binding protein